MNWHFFYDVAFFIKIYKINLHVRNSQINTKLKLVLPLIHKPTVLKKKKEKKNHKPTHEREGD